MLRKPAGLVLGLLLTVALASPASALLYTVDASGDGVLQLDGSDDLLVDVNGDSTNDAAIRAVDIFSVLPAIAGSQGVVDFETQDVLLFQVSALSAPVDQIELSVFAAGPSNPVGAGWLVGSDVAPSGITLTGGFFSFPGNARFDFPGGGSEIPAGSSSNILFATYSPVGSLELGDLANFMVSAGSLGNQDFSVSIVPEPSTLVLLAGGLVAAGLLRRRRQEAR